MRRTKFIQSGSSYGRRELLYYFFRKLVDDTLADILVRGANTF